MGCHENLPKKSTIMHFSVQIVQYMGVSTKIKTLMNGACWSLYVIELPKIGCSPNLCFGSYIQNFDWCQHT